MTYIAAWKAHGTVFVVADTATTLTTVTTATRQQASRQLTSFSELPHQDSESVVFEGTLKILNLGTAVVAFAGDVSVANEMISCLKSLVDGGSSPDVAFSTVVSSFTPLRTPNQVALLLAYPSPGAPRLLVFNESGTQTIEEAGEATLFQLGQLPPTQRRFTEAFLTWQYGILEAPHRILCTSMAVLQSYGVQEHLLASGVGGTFTGCYVTEVSILWQPDLLYLLTSTGPSFIDTILSCVRGNALVVSSSANRSLKVFANSTSCGPLDEWLDSWNHAIKNFTTRPSPAFVISLNVLTRTLALCDMTAPGIESHLQLSVLDAHGAGEAFRLELRMSELLIGALQHRPELPDGAFGLQPFWFPPPKSNAGAGQA